MASGDVLYETTKALTKLELDNGVLREQAGAMEWFKVSRIEFNSEDESSDFVAFVKDMRTSTTLTLPAGLAVGTQYKIQIVEV